MDGYIKAQLGSSFLINAGICGFIRFLQANDAQEGNDYIIDDQELFISIEYLRSNDIPLMYIDTFARLFEKDTKFYRVVYLESKEIDSLNARFEELDKREINRIKDLYKRFEEMMLKKSFKSGYEIMLNYETIIPINEQMIMELKKECDFSKKYIIYKNILRLLDQKRIKTILVFEELMYSKLNMFYDDKSFPVYLSANKKLMPERVFEKIFFAPLLYEIENEKKKKNKYCIECMSYSSEVKPISFMVDSTDDVTRKKSYYWNCKPDAYVCPLCAFVYCFIPLGFNYVGNEAIFINSNSNINILLSLMGAYQNKISISEDINRKSYYSAFVDGKIQMYENKVSNFQIVTRSLDYSHFKFSIVDNDMVSKLIIGKKLLVVLEKLPLKPDDRNNDKYISIYNTTMDLLLSRNSLYLFIERLLKIELKSGNNANYLLYLLKLQNIFYGGVNMKSLNSKVQIAFEAGNKVRNIILSNKKIEKSEEKEKSIRGIVYRLANLTSAGDTHQFIDTIIRIYSSYGLVIPEIFKECYKSEDVFNAIAHGFIIGMKSEKENKED